MYTLMKPVGAAALAADFPLGGDHGPSGQHLPQPAAGEGEVGGIGNLQGRLKGPYQIETAQTMQSLTQDFEIGNRASLKVYLPIVNHNYILKFVVCVGFKSTHVST